MNGEHGYKLLKTKKKIDVNNENKIREKQVYTTWIEGRIEQQGESKGKEARMYLLDSFSLQLSLTFSVPLLPSVRLREKHSLKHTLPFHTDRLVVVSVSRTFNLVRWI